MRHPLSFALGSRAATATLRELALHGGLVSALLLERQTGLARNSVISALRSLISLGLVDEQGSERTRLYQFSQAHPLAASLTQIFSLEDNRFRRILEAIEAAAAEVGAEAAWLYGSAARGDDAEASDVDILIAISQKNESLVERLRERLSGEGERLRFKPALVVLDASDVLRLSRDNDPWWQSIAVDALVLFGPGPQQLFRNFAHPERGAKRFRK